MNKAIRNALATAILSALLVFTGCDAGGNDSDPSNPSTDQTNPPKLPKTWTEVTTIEASNNTINKVAYGNGRFVAAGGGTFTTGGYKSAAYWSADGRNWTATDQAHMTAIFSTDNMHVFFGNGWFIAHPSSSGNSHWGKSQNGVDWEAIGNASTWTGAGDHPYINSKGGVYANGYWIVTGSGGRISYSSDTITWTLVSGTTTTFDNPQGGPRSFINAAAYGKGKFVIGGGSGHIAYASAPDETWNPTLKHANQSETIVNFTNPQGANYWPNGGEVAETIFDNWFINAMVYAEDKGRFVAVGGLDSGGDGKAAYSDDGITWTQSDELEPVGFGCKMNAVAYGDGVFVLADNNGNAAYSTDGVKWTVIDDTQFNTATPTKPITTIAYGNGVWVFAGSNGRIAYSKPE